MKKPSPVTALVVTLAALGFACSAAPDSGSLGGSESAQNAGNPPKAPTSSTTTSPTTPSSPSTPTTPTGPTTPEGDAVCASKGDACGDCCEAAHPTGASDYDDALDACLCGAQGHCQTECAATTCSDADNAPEPKDGDACDLCIQKYAPEDGTGACDAALAAALQKSADGQALQKCLDSCPD